MTKQEALTKFNRISNDPRQAQAFVQDLLDGKLIESGTKLYKHTIVVEGTYDDMQTEFTIVVVSPYAEKYNLMEGNGATLSIVFFNVDKAFVISMGITENFEEIYPVVSLSGQPRYDRLIATTSVDSSITITSVTSCTETVTAI